MIGLLWLLTGLYALGTGWLWWAWRRIPAPAGHVPGGPLPTLTVVIPVRNEAAGLPHLLADLSRQTYPHFEVIVADDASTDDTAACARAFAQTAPFCLTVLSLPDDPALTAPKKRAIARSIDRATGTFIVTTDGDCRVGPRWLESIARYQAQTGAKLISGPVTFTPSNTIFGALQTVEFASLIGAGAATLARARPTMCNGANLGYEAAAFRAVGGFAGIDQVASGDDELLMHKLAAHYPGGVRFLKSRDAIVETVAHRSAGAFYQQRKRWAGKWRTYQSPFPTLVAVLVFCCNLAPLLAVGAWAAGYVTAAAALGLVLLKLVPEWFFLSSVLLFLRQRRALRWIPLTQCLYPFYVVFFGLAAQRPGVVWKGRKLT